MSGNVGQFMNTYTEYLPQKIYLSKNCVTYIHRTVRKYVRKCMKLYIKQRVDMHSTCILILFDKHTPRLQPSNHYDVAIRIYFICLFPLQIIILFIPFVIAFGIPFFLLLRERYRVSCLQFRSNEVIVSQVRRCKEGAHMESFSTLIRRITN